MEMRDGVRVQCDALPDGVPSASNRLDGQRRTRMDDLPTGLRPPTWIPESVIAVATPRSTHTAIHPLLPHRRQSTVHQETRVDSSPSDPRLPATPAGRR